MRWSVGMNASNKRPHTAFLRDEADAIPLRCIRAHDRAGGPLHPARGRARRVVHGARHHQGTARLHLSRYAFIYPDAPSLIPMRLHLSWYAFIYSITVRLHLSRYAQPPDVCLCLYLCWYAPRCYHVQCDSALLLTSGHFTVVNTKALYCGCDVMYTDVTARLVDSSNVLFFGYVCRGNPVRSSFSVPGLQ